MDLKARYEAVQYKTIPLVQTHPVHLATLCQLHGLAPADPRACRYLEVGCANGLNIIGMACSYPESTFVGIDLSESAIAEGQAMIERLSLKNVQLIAGDLLQYPLDSKPFDYITAHGFYSWVPVHVRAHLWTLCHKLLSPQGIFYLSYNAYPGCHQRQMFREMMLFHVNQFEDPQDKVYQARAFLKLVDLAQTVEKKDASSIRHELHQLIHVSDDCSIYHDDLSAINEPKYFHEMVKEAGTYGMQFVSEADFFEMGYLHYPEGVQAPLRAMEEHDILLKEQYLDFLKFRRFRESLWCRQGLTVQRPVTLDRIKDQLVTAQARAQGELKLEAGEAITFANAKGSRLTLNHPLSKRALQLLGETYPRHWSFIDLYEHSSKMLQETGLAAVTDQDHEMLAKTMLTAYTVGFLELHCLAPAMALSQPERPCISPLIADQLQQGRKVVTNLMHLPIRIDSEFVATFLQLCDGTRTRQQLIEACSTLANKPGIPMADAVGQATKEAIHLALFIDTHPGTVVAGS
jgi:methyltransferase-like protein/cyclopropane fatty-acyl-phospholipid synthase-like methyltransferase